MKTIYSILFLLSWGVGTLKAQDFLSINPDAEAMATGNLATAMPATAFSFYHNAAAPLFAPSRWQTGISYGPWMRGVAKGYSLTALGGYARIHSRHLLAAGFRFYHEPEIKTPDAPDWGEYPFLPKDENNQPMEKSFTSAHPHQFAVEVAYGYQITSKIGIALTGRYLHISLDDFGKAQGMGFDVSAFSRLPLSLCDSTDINFGIQISNIGFISGDFSPELPRKVNIGTTLALPFSKAHQLLINLGGGYQFYPASVKSLEMALGAAYTYRNLLTLRGGYHLADQHGYDYLTLGTGISIRHLEAAFAYLIAANDCPLHNTYRLGVNIKF